MSIDDTKIAHAVDAISTQIDKLSDPNTMTREEAFEFYDALTEEIEEKRRALKEIADA